MAVQDAGDLGMEGKRGAVVECVIRPLLLLPTYDWPLFWGKASQDLLRQAQFVYSQACFSQGLEFFFLKTIEVFLDAKLDGVCSKAEEGNWRSDHHLL